MDLGSRQLTVFSQPDGAAYTQIRVCQAEDILVVPGFPEVTLRVNDLGL